MILLRISQHKKTSYTFRRSPPRRVLALSAVVTFVAGCFTPSGQWQLVEVDPPGAAFPITQIKFDDGGAYQAKGRYTPDGEPTRKTQSSTGRFSQEDGLLRLAPEGHGAIGLDTYVRLDGKMVMTLQPPGRKWKIRGIFKRVDPIDPRLLDPAKPITPESLKAKQAATLKD